jgi:hypothetical protein
VSVLFCGDNSAIVEEMIVACGGECLSDGWVDGFVVSEYNDRREDPFCAL